jgi:hypothetical protein
VVVEEEGFQDMVMMMRRRGPFTGGGGSGESDDSSSSPTLNYLNRADHVIASSIVSVNTNSPPYRVEWGDRVRSSSDVM